MALVLGVLLYGSEVRSPCEDLCHRPRRFLNRCASTMYRITIAHTIRRRITTKSPVSKPKIDPLDTYYNRRLLRWAGRVSRMHMFRAPRELLTSWVAKPRPVGSPNDDVGPGAQQGPPSCRRPFCIHQVAGLRCIP